MSETKTPGLSGEQAPAEEVNILSPAKALAHWQIDQDIVNASAAGASETTLEVLQFKKTIIDTKYLDGDRVETRPEDPDVLRRVREFKEAHGVEEDLDPMTVRMELATRARWNLSGYNPDDYSASDRNAIESDWKRAANIQREIERLIDRRDNVELKWANELLAGGSRSAIQAGEVAVQAQVQAPNLES